MERRNLFAVFLCHILHNLSKGCVVDIHIRHEHKTGKLIFLADLPCLLRAHFHTGLTGYHDDGRIRCAHRFFHFSYKIKETGRIKHIDLVALPLNRNNRCGDRDMSFLLLLTKIAHRVPVVYLAHSGCDAGKICHRFHKTCLTAAPVPQ